MNNRNDESAFPVPIGNTDERQWGMSLRDWFAGMAIQGLLARGIHPDIEISAQGYRDAAAVESYQQADAMLKAREAKQ